MSMLWLGDVPDLDRNLVGGKALSINKMRNLGLPVPPAFVLTTNCCQPVIDNNGELTDSILDSLRDGLRRLEEETGRRLGGGDRRPLLVSVRSGGAQSMPGMMDTVLNLGINDDIEAILAEASRDPGFAADTHRRYREQFEKVVGAQPTGDPWEDVVNAAEAVFRSWNSPRAISYRKHHGIADNGGTSVTIQAMVFGNLDHNSGTGVLFTRNPMTGEPEAFGEWLPGGQGEDVVSGRFDAQPLDTLRTQLPEIYDELMSAAETLEHWGKDAQDIEFTVERGKLFLLQTRAAKRSPQAAVRIAVALHERGVIDKDAAVALVSDAQLEAAMQPHIDPLARASATVLATGLPACPGVAVGTIVTSCEEAEDLSDEGKSVILARPTTDPDDVAGMVVSSAVITEIGGSTSHAAVVSRELGTPCAVGCGKGTLTKLAGQTVTVDGTTGEIFEGALPVVTDDTQEHEAALTLMEWAGRAPQGV